MINKIIDIKKIRMVGQKPHIQCEYCQSSVQPGFLLISAVDWLTAAIQCGWRNHIKDNATDCVICPGCIGEIETTQVQQEQRIAQ